MSKRITRNTTCLDLFDFTETEYCCSVCRVSLDAHANYRKKRKTNEKKSKRNKCEQQWLDSYATTSTRAMFHEKACNYLGLPLGVTIEDIYAYEK